MAAVLARPQMLGVTQNLLSFCCPLAVLSTVQKCSSEAVAALTKNVENADAGVAECLDISFTTFRQTLSPEPAPVQSRGTGRGVRIHGD